MEGVPYVYNKRLNNSSLRGERSAYTAGHTCDTVHLNESRSPAGLRYCLEKLFIDLVCLFV